MKTKTSTYKPNPHRVKKTGIVIQVIIAIIFALIILVPVVMVVWSGLLSHAELLAGPIRIPYEFRWDHYKDVLFGEGTTFWLMLWNSTKIMLISTTGVVALGSMVSYALSRLKWRGRELVFNFFTLGLLFPAAVAILPLYLIIRSAGLLDTHIAIWLPGIAFGLPITIIILRGFFAQIPKEIEEAASIDGASIIRTFFTIILPIMRPPIAAVAVLSMVGSWNAFFWPLLAITSEELYTLPLGIMQFSRQFYTDYASVMAYVALAMIPAIAFYVIAEKQIVKGLTGGAIKG